MATRIECDGCDGCGGPVGADHAEAERLAALKVLSIIPRVGTPQLCVYCLNAVSNAAIDVLAKRRSERDARKNGGA
jgi:hypothetical protein